MSFQSEDLPNREPPHVEEPGLPEGACEAARGYLNGNGAGADDLSELTEPDLSDIELLLSDNLPPVAPQAPMPAPTQDERPVYITAVPSAGGQHHGA